jgi:hypothetical protein
VDLTRSGISEGPLKDKYQEQLGSSLQKEQAEDQFKEQLQAGEALDQVPSKDWKDHSQDGATRTARSRTSKWYWTSTAEGRY